MRLTSLACLTAVAFLFGALPPARACTPSESNPAGVAQDEARDAAMAPNVWRTARQAADIVIGHAQFTDAPETDVPAPYRGQDHRAGLNDLRPVRYVFVVDRVIKGAPPPQFDFRPPPVLMSYRGMANTWTTRWNPEFQTFHLARAEREFWRLGQGGLGSLSGPGDCSNQIAFEPGRPYLIARDAGGVMLMAEPLDDNDPLPDAVARFVADPAAPAYYTMSVTDYLALPGGLIRVEVSACDPVAVKILEVLKDDTPMIGETIPFDDGGPGLDRRNCRIGRQYLLEGVLAPDGLHPIEDGWVTFDDSYIGLRFAGPKRMPLEDVRRLTKATSLFGLPR